MRAATLRALNEARRAKRAVVLATWLDTGEEILIGEGDAPDAVLAGHAEEAFASGRSVLETIGERPLFLHVFEAPLRLIAVGAVHVAEPLVSFAGTAGYDITIVDPRRAWTGKGRFPGVAVVESWPADALEALAPDRRTAVVALTHDPKIDDPALRRALASPAFYVGALGSRRTHAARLERLREAGVDEGEAARIRAPVGLDIGAATPAEIALSIMAEVVAAQRGRLP